MHSLRGGGQLLEAVFPSPPDSAGVQAMYLKQKWHKALFQRPLLPSFLRSRSVLLSLPNLFTFDALSLKFRNGTWYIWRSLFSYNFSSFLKVESLQYLAIHFNTAAIFHKSFWTQGTNRGNMWLRRCKFRYPSTHPNTRIWLDTLGISEYISHGSSLWLSHST